MPKQVIGILGGMGPEATLDCFDKIIKNTPAQRDQDHLRVIIDSNPAVPDRTAAIVGDGQSPVPVIVEGCHALEKAGADFIIIP
jgi:aspartate racemase